MSDCKVNPIAVLAGTRAEYVSWCHEHHLNPDFDTRYIRGEIDLLGGRFSKYVRIGTWYRQSLELQGFFGRHEALAKAIGEVRR